MNTKIRVVPNEYRGMEWQWIEAGLWVFGYKNRGIVRNPIAYVRNVGPNRHDPSWRWQLVNEAKSGLAPSPWSYLSAIEEVEKMMFDWSDSTEVEKQEGE